MERLRNAQVAAFKLLVYRLRVESKAQKKLINEYGKYFVVLFERMKGLI